MYTAGMLGTLLQSGKPLKTLLLIHMYLQVKCTVRTKMLLRCSVISYVQMMKVMCIICMYKENTIDIWSI